MQLKLTPFVPDTFNSPGSAVVVKISVNRK